MGVYQRGKSWEYVIELPSTLVDGVRKRNQERRSGFTLKADATKAYRLRLAQVEQGIQTHPERVTLGAYLLTWLDGRQRLRGASYRAYLNYIKRQISPYLGAIMVRDLTPNDIERWLRWATPQWALRTIYGAHTMLRSALTQAERRGLVARNVAALVERVSVPKQDMAVWTAAQAATFLSVTANERDAALWLLALATGMRAGELCGLLWENVDLERRELHVRTQMTHTRTGKLELGPPKTSAGQRRIVLDDRTVAALRRHRTQQRETRLRRGYKDAGHVFLNLSGRTLTPENMSSRMRGLVTLAGVPSLTPHGLRHTHATLFLAAGEDVASVSERLGHASIAVTLDVYRHVLEQERLDHRERVALVLGLA